LHAERQVQNCALEPHGSPGAVEARIQERIQLQGVRAQALEEKKDDDDDERQKREPPSIARVQLLAASVDIDLFQIVRVLPVCE